MRTLPIESKDSIRELRLICFNIALAMITHLLIYISGQTQPLPEITKLDGQFIKGALHCL